MKSHVLDPNTVQSLHVPRDTELVYLKADKLVAVTYPGWDVELSRKGKLFIEPPSAREAAVQMKDVVIGGAMSISNVSTGSPSDRIPVVIVPESHKEVISVHYF